MASGTFVQSLAVDLVCDGEDGCNKSSENFQEAISEQKLDVCNTAFNGNSLPKKSIMQRQNSTYRRKESGMPNQQFQKGYCIKRRHTFSGPDLRYLPKKRRKMNCLLSPTKFLLGGSITDPLNLQSLEDEEVNRRVNEKTPYSSPVPTPKHHTQVEVLIPPNINDPLNLNSGEEIDFGLLSPNSKRRHRHRQKRKRSESQEAKTEIKTENEVEEGMVCKQNKQEETQKCDEANEKVKTEVEVGPDVIVSPRGATRFSKQSFRKNVSKNSCDDCQKEEREDTQQKRGRSRRKSRNAEPPNFKQKNAQFQFGNYNRYYGYRNQQAEDERLKCMRREWFENKDVLDIGCNVGHLTLSLAKDYNPRKIIGLDIDEQLIRVARRNVRHYITAELSKGAEFPISMLLCHGPIAAAALPGRQDKPSHFPNNVFFIQGNYVLESDELLEAQQPEFDCILCLSLTKWIHLNWGDEGLKRVFQRMYAQLRPGGRVILEAQAWKSYARKKKLTETIFKNYQNIKFRPEQFNEYLLSKEVGFSTCTLVDMPAHPSKGFCRPIYVFTKAESASGGLPLNCEDNL
ncbi:LOW QUALITY PROTEIN: 7SK snRNA methylphosphate capping enzyme-like [Tachypleus tridentatus]|uniref:LOW QUALITY PROTEIN: 7SK snRNA methylphosphate capping enzyme-like n=1 Tax=Tachypleus tridentatus TaxID=6853 RepID=UPI003FD653AE